MHIQRVILVLAAATACLTTPGARADTTPPTYDVAVHQFRDHQWADAYGRFMDLANRGDPDAARIALFMLRYGPTLYGAYWNAMPHEVRRWQLLAASGRGRSAPQFVPDLYLQDQ